MPFLFAQLEPDAWKWWIDVVGSVSSVVGLMITLIGFPTLWWMQRKI
jgi:hypothetical protein